MTALNQPLEGLIERVEAGTPDIDWSATPPFITAISGGDGYEVTIKVHSLAELHAAHDLVLKAFSDAHADLLAKRWADANQG